MVIVHNHQKICLWETKKQNALQTDEQRRVNFNSPDTQWLGHKKYFRLQDISKIKLLPERTIIEFSIIYQIFLITGYNKFCSVFYFTPVYAKLQNSLIIDPSFNVLP